jgi:hypothetical protein
MGKLEQQLSTAVKHFWQTRSRQGRKQGASSGQRDSGNRAVATGGKQLDGFTHLICELIIEAGIPPDCIFWGGRKFVTLPGFFRPTKQWDVLVVARGNLLAAIECKALCGPSFGNNYNNRVEEALGSATDLWTAYREGAFDHSPRPFLGYFLLLEEAVGSTRPVSVSEEHFEVFAEFRNASYAGRCEATLLRLIRERSYDATSLLLSDEKRGRRGCYSEPSTDLSFGRFATLMCGQVASAYKVVAD